MRAEPVSLNALSGLRSGNKYSVRITLVPMYKPLFSHREPRIIIENYWLLSEITHPKYRRRPDPLAVVSRPNSS